MLISFGACRWLNSFPCVGETWGASDQEINAAQVSHSKVMCTFDRIKQNLRVENKRVPVFGSTQQCEVASKFQSFFWVTTNNSPSPTPPPWLPWTSLFSGLVPTAEPQRGILLREPWQHWVKHPRRHNALDHFYFNSTWVHLLVLNLKVLIFESYIPPIKKKIMWKE